MRRILWTDSIPFGSSTILDGGRYSNNRTAAGGLRLRVVGQASHGRQPLQITQDRILGFRVGSPEPGSRVDRPPAPADLEVQLRRRPTAAVAGGGNGLPGADRLADPFG